MSVDKVEVLLECPICCDYFQTVAETPCCHGLYCKDCISDWRKSRTTCPQCRQPLDITKLLVNIPIQRFVDAIPMECPYKLEGCGAKPPRSELARHKELCTYHPERLANQKKGKMEALATKRKQLEQQEKEYRAKEKSQTKDQNAKKAHELASVSYEIGKELFDLVEKKEAIEMIEKALRLNNEGTGPNNELAVDCLSLLAKIYMIDAEYDKSLQLYQEAMRVANLLKLSDKVSSLYCAVGDVHSKLAKFDVATENYNKALETAKKFLGATAMKTAEVFNCLGLVAKKCSEYDKAIAAYMDAMKIIQDTDPLWNEVALNLADVYRKKGKYNEAKDLYLKALKKAESKFGNNHPQVAELSNALGMLAKKEGLYNEALRYYTNAIKIARHFQGNDHPSIGMYLTNVGDIHRKQGDFKKAEGIYLQAIATLEKTLGPNHIEVAEVLNSMGLVLKKRAEYDKAEDLYNRAINIVIKTFGEKHYKVGIYLNNLGDIERKRGNYDQALQIYTKALKAIELTLGHTHSEAAEILHNMGLIKHQLLKYDEAIKLYKSALDIVRKEFGPKHYKVGMFLNNSGLSYAMVGDYKVAYDELKQALQILITCLGRDHIEVADCYANLGDVCMKLVVEAHQKAKLEEANKYYTEANRITELMLGKDHTKSKQYASLLFICENYSSLV